MKGRAPSMIDKHDFGLELPIQEEAKAEDEGSFINFDKPQKNLLLSIDSDLISEEEHQENGLADPNGTFESLF